MKAKQEKMQITTTTKPNKKKKKIEFLKENTDLRENTTTKFHSSDVIKYVWDLPYVNLLIIQFDILRVQEPHHSRALPSTRALGRSRLVIVI